MNPAPGVRELFAGAAALVRVVAAADFPFGFVIVADTLPERVRGISVGDGVALAKLYRVRGGQSAVVMDPAKYTPDDAAQIEAHALHEAAHALTGRAADVDTVERALETLPGLPALPATTAATHHEPRWAFALAVLALRALPFRRTRADGIRRVVVHDLAVYGYSADEMFRLAGDVAPDEPLRARLELGGLWDTFLVSRVSDDDTRAAAIVDAGAYRAATGVA
jgi:hypothetical protein